MKLKINQLLDAAAPLRTINGTDMPIQLSLKLVHNVQAFDAVIKEYEKRRKEHLEEYGTFQPEQNNYRIDEKRVDEFNKIMVDLTSEEVDIDIKIIKLTELPQGHRIKPMDLHAMIWMFENDLSTQDNVTPMPNRKKTKQRKRG